MTEKKAILTKGNAKDVFTTENSENIVLHFKDTATAYHNIKKATITGKGVLTNKISAILFKKLNEAGIESHFVSLLNDREQLCKKLTIIPIRVITRNIASGSIVHRLGIDDGTIFQSAVYEYNYKKEELDNPFINEHHIVALGLATYNEIAQINNITTKINGLLSDIFHSIGIALVDFKLEFGRTADGTILLADEISPDTCRLWDESTKKRLDKDRFRRDMGDIIDAYNEIYSRLEKL